eukprot:6977384-Prymnesium_polylepis.1
MTTGLVMPGVALADHMAVEGLPDGGEVKVAAAGQQPPQRLREVALEFTDGSEAQWMRGIMQERWQEMSGA